jgi:hypothetical protein
VWQWFAAWAKFVVADRKEIAVALDWTHFDADKQATISLNAITSHGRATPLVWKTVDAKLLANREQACGRACRRRACGSWGP